MRTTLQLDEDLLRELEQRAREEGSTLSELVNRAIRKGLAAEPRPRPVFQQRTRDLGRPSFDVAKATAVAGARDDETLLRKRTGSS